jgi:uncharacterized protein
MIAMITMATLSILCCPESHQPVAPADAALIRRLNEQIAAGSLRNRSGKPVTASIDEGLLREDGKILYPVRDNIPLMLVAEGIPLV